MTASEKRNLISTLGSIVVYLTYLIVIFLRAGDGPLADVPYVWPMVWSIAGFISVHILAHIILRIISPKEAELKDERDDKIERYGEMAGNAFNSMGMMVALILIMNEAPYFWIANTLFLGCMVSTLVGAAAKVYAYQIGLPKW